MNIFAIPTILTSIILFFLGAYVYLKNRHLKSNIIFGLLCFSMFIWLLGFSLMYLSKSPERALIWGKIGFMGIVFIPFIVYHFAISFIDYTDHYMYYIYPFGVISIFINFFTPLIYKDVKLHFWGYYPVAGKFYFVYLILFIVCFGYAAFLLYKSLQNDSISLLRKQQIKYVFFPIIPGTLGIVDYIAKYSSLNVYPYGYIFALLFVVSIGYAILKYRIMDIRVVITRAGIFVLLYAIVLGIPFYVAYRTGSGLLSTAFAVLLASIGPAAYRSLHQRAEGLILAEQKRYQLALHEASTGMVREHNLDKLLNLVVGILRDTVKINYSAVFTDDKQNLVYELKALSGGEGRYSKSLLSYDNPLVKYIKSVKAPFTLEELPDEVKSSPVVANMPISLIIPSFIEDKLMGFIVLGEKVNKTIYTQDDINVFTTLSNQMALAIENCLYLDESRNTQERLFTAEKLASIGGMAEGIAHQIMNRMNQFTLNSQAIEVKTERFKKDRNEEQFFSDLNTISNSQMKNIQRTTDIVKGILNYSSVEIDERNFSTFSIEDIINPSLELLRIKHNITEFPLKLEINMSDGTVYGVKAQLMEVIYNILDNAYESTLEKKGQSPDYKSEITVKICEAAKPANIIIEIADNGIGIKEENKGKVFAPFFTTKATRKSGSGIGCYIVKRIIEENHKGKIWFNSNYMAGSTFYLEIPVRA
jgi:signal transduction histidine kinase